MSANNKKKPGVFSVFIKFITAFVAVILVLIPIFLALIMYLNSAPHKEGHIFSAIERDGIRITQDGVCYIDVRRGESSQSVGMRLESTGLIRNRYFWNLLSRMESEYIKSGTYRLEIPSSQISIHRLLVSGKQILHRVTVPEGVTLGKASRILEEAGICSADDFLQAARDTQIINEYKIPNASLEGYLFPDTYLFPAGYPASQVVRVMTDNFFTRIEAINPLVTSMSPKELNEKVIIASIVEREYRISEEAPLMAGVFFNRLRINMALQSCATVEYIITEIQGKPHPSQLFNQDLEIQNPYNTYQRAGLPPGPISAPGAVALRAAMFPERTEFLYFRVNNPATGSHYFSRTLDEHIRAGNLITKPQS